MGISRTKSRGYALKTGNDFDAYYIALASGLAQSVMADFGIL